MLVDPNDVGMESESVLVVSPTDDEGAGKEEEAALVGVKTGGQGGKGRDDELRVRVRVERVDESVVL